MEKINVDLELIRIQKLVDKILTNNQKNMFYACCTGVLMGIIDNKVIDENKMKTVDIIMILEKQLLRIQKMKI